MAAINFPQNILDPVRPRIFFAAILNLEAAKEMKNQESGIKKSWSSGWLLWSFV